MINKDILNKIDNNIELTDTEIIYCIQDLGVDEEMGSPHRWETPMNTIFQIEDRLFSIEWNKGNTEYQENSYYDGFPFEVKKQKRTIVVEEYVKLER